MENDPFNLDMVEVLEMREAQLTQMIKLLQKKRRAVQSAIVTLKTETLSPVPSVAETNSEAEKTSGGNNRTFPAVQTWDSDGRGSGN